MTIKIHFDSLSPGTIVTNQFESKGILFTSPCAVVRDPDTFKTSLQSRHQSSITALPTRVIRGRFIDPHHSRLGVTASFSNAGPEGVSAILRIFDANGKQIEERPFGSTSAVAHVEIHSPAANISGWEVSGRTNAWDAIDSLSYDFPTAADFKVVYEGGAEPLELRRGGTVRAKLSFARLHGSHGEIALGVVKPCPGTTWRFEPAVVGNGVMSVEMVVRADEEAEAAYHFAVHVVAMPRTKGAGRHEHEVAVPVSIVGGGKADEVVEAC